MNCKQMQYANSREQNFKLIARNIMCTSDITYIQYYYYYSNNVVVNNMQLYSNYAY